MRSEGSQEEDDLVSNQVAFSGMLVSGNQLFMQGRSDFVATDSVCLSMKSNIVATDNKSATSSTCHSDSNSGDDSKKDDESLQEAYKKIYTQWLKVSASNQALNSEIQVLCELNPKAEGKIFELEVLLAKKVEDLKSVTTKLERTQKSLRFLNNSLSKLNHLITTGKSFGDHGDIGYKSESSSSRTIFVKSSLLDDSINVSGKKPIAKSVVTKQSVAIGKFVSDSRHKKEEKKKVRFLFLFFIFVVLKVTSDLDVLS